MTLSRRSFIGVTAAAVGALAAGTRVSAQNLSAADASGYRVQPLPFHPAKLNGISERLIVSHHDKNYAGAVRRLSAIQERIRQLPADSPPFQMGALKREELIAMNSMILHEYYFENLGGDGKAAGNALDLIKQQFGSYEDWEHEFKLTGLSLSGGSGWVMLSFSPHDTRVYNVWSSDHTQGLAAGKPLLVMDMYEHSYQMDYGADAKGYIQAFFKNINWEAVQKRIEA